MAAAESKELVQLLQDVPELGLRRGDMGVVCSTWFTPGTAIEVEFRPDGLAFPIRTLLMPSQIQKDANYTTN